MVSRENRVLLASTTLVLVALGVAAAASPGGSTLVALAIVAGVGVLGPQVYLARTDDEVAPRSRIRAGVLVSVLILGGAYGNVDPAHRTPLAVVVASLLVGLVGYEFLAGYRAAAPAGTDRR